MPTVQVFEHQRVRVGDGLRTTSGAEVAFTPAHHAALANFADATADRYLRCGRNAIRFTAYVGFIQLGNLGIEVLPKADRDEPSSPTRWHRALVHMLRVTGDLGLEAPDEAKLQTDPGRLFELFVGRFMDECERLLHEGLAKAYRSEEANHVAFRGRLLVGEHIRRNAANGARFYVASPVYDHQSLPNLALIEALRIIETLPISPGARSRARGLRYAFPELPPWRPDEAKLLRLRLNRQTTRYSAALRLARLILFHLTPNVHAGETPLLALLFNMNNLWERYVATIARQIHLPGLQVRTQHRANFWRDERSRRTLRPDITVSDADGTRLVIDTKWKVPGRDRADSGDLKQMFCYHELFGSPRTILLYPSTREGGYVSDVGRFEGTEHRCALAFVAVDGDIEAELQTLLEDQLRDP